jgi:hypothetical protein
LSQFSTSPTFSLLEENMHRMLIIVWCAVATFLGIASAFADPQLSAGAGVTPQVLVGGTNVTFQFSLTNSGAAEVRICRTQSFRSVGRVPPSTAFSSISI